MSKSRFTDLLKSEQQRIEKGLARPKESVISVTEYLDKVIDNPSLARTAHKRLDDMIMEHGLEWVDREDGSGKRIKYNFFNDKLFGIEDTIEKIVDYFKAGGQRLPTRKRILLLMGPPGGGKSTVVHEIKRGLEQFTRTDNGAVYRIKDCPQSDDPLTLLPSDLRTVLHEEHGIKVEGTPCPVCTWRLENEFNGDWTKFNVERYRFSEQLRTGIGTFVPSDSKTMDIAELVGSINLAKIGEYGNEADPRAYDFNGEINISNRGMIEFVEMLKVDDKFLYVLLTLSQEQNIKSPRFPLIFADEVIIAHTNESEWQKFIKKPENEALRDRVITILCPYNLKLSDEVKINAKLLKESGQTDIHIAPHTLECASMVAIMSRLEEPKDKSVTLLKKMKAYDGQEVDGLRKQEVEEMKKNTDREGMDGIGPRYISNCLSKAITKSREVLSKKIAEEDTSDLYGVTKEDLKTLKISVDPIMVLQSVREEIMEDPKIPTDQKSGYEDIIEHAKEEFNRLVSLDVHKAFVYGFEEEAKDMFKSYIDHAIAYADRDKVQNPITGDMEEPNEEFMRSIEKHATIHESSKNEFRNEILRRMGGYAAKNKIFNYNTHKTLKEAIEKEIFDRRKDAIHMTTNSINPDPEQLEELNRVIKRLVTEMGYDPISANKALKYVSRNSSRG